MKIRLGLRACHPMLGPATVRTGPRKRLSAPTLRLSLLLLHGRLGLKTLMFEVGPRREKEVDKERSRWKACRYSVLLCRTSRLFCLTCWLLAGRSLKHDAGLRAETRMTFLYVGIPGSGELGPSVNRTSPGWRPRGRVPWTC